MPRSYYTNNIPTFLRTGYEQLLGILAKNHRYALEEQQRNAWLHQIEILQDQLAGLDRGQILFEYSIPRMGKRVDTILILDGLVFILEFKLNETHYRMSDLDQCLDYALDLKYFHEGSHMTKLVPILIATDAPPYDNTEEKFEDEIFKPLRCNKKNLRSEIERFVSLFGGEVLDATAWENAGYKPTPTIIEAAQALFQGHDVREISRSDAGADNMTKTANTINQIIERTKSQKNKSICFITGVPGAGKTLAGLNLANQRHNIAEEEHAVFLSGNGPLVEVLREALARSRVENSTNKVNKSEALREARAFIQNIHHFRDAAIDNPNPPLEKVVIFDEAQRAWNERQTSSFMKKKRNINNFAQSEPEFLVGIMDRHSDWCVIICLVGGGQEINTGEAGIIEWFTALRKRFNYWQVYVSDEIFDDVYTRGTDLETLINDVRWQSIPHLHLRTSLRSFRSASVEKFIKAILDLDKHAASQLYSEIYEKYPIVIARDIWKAKLWLRQKGRANERIGLVASSGAKRLKPYGIFVESKIDPRVWFLNRKDDVRSSFFLEDVATEFDIQGLELDWICVAWDADLRLINDQYQYCQFRGNDWQKILDPESKLYLKNTYRVLLTRARQGMIIFIPRGDSEDETQSPSFYDQLYGFFKEVGLEEIL